MHHLLMRENLGFNYFYIGRDHAGAQNLYRPNAASETAIKSITSKGGYLCLKCKDYVIKGTCGHKGLINISGTDFRFSLKEKSVYQHSDKELQKIIYKRI